MLENPNVWYELSVRVLLSTKGMPTRSAEIFSWDTSKLLKHVLKNDKTLLPNKRTRLIRRVQDKNSRWAILKYTIWESRSGPLKRIVLSLWLYDFKAEFELRRDTANRLISRISEILYKVDPADLAAVDAPRDEYNPEAEWIADRIFIGREDLSPSMIKEVFESLFSKGTGSDELFQTATDELTPVVQEHLKQLDTEISTRAQTQTES